MTQYQFFQLVDSLSTGRNTPQRRENLHLHGLVATTTYNLVRHEVDAVDFVRVTRQVDFDFVRLQIPDLFTALDPACRCKRAFTTHL